MLRFLIAGGPRVGKTTLSQCLAGGLGIQPRKTDELIGTYDFAEAHPHVAAWFDVPGPWVIEGVTVPRALRHWLATHADGVPCDQVFWSDFQKAERTPAQQNMAKGCRTVWMQVEDELRRRGVNVQRF
jgi:hypothetical protein